MYKLELVLSLPLWSVLARYGGFRRSVCEYELQLGCAAYSFPAAARLSAVLVEAAIAHLVITNMTKFSAFHNVSCLLNTQLSSTHV